MGTGASEFKTKEEALAAGKTEAEIDEYLKANPATGFDDAAPAAAATATETGKKAVRKPIRAVTRRTVPKDHSCLFTSFGLYVDSKTRLKIILSSNSIPIHVCVCSLPR